MALLKGSNYLLKILAIDTSCDDSCVAILETEGFRLLADVVMSHTEAMKPYGGVVPEIASREHLKALPIALDWAIHTAGIQLSGVEWIVATHRPGLVGALVVGVSFGKSLAYSLGVPFSGFDHVEAHLFSPFLALSEEAEPPPLPWIALIASGGHTELFRVDTDAKAKWLSGTLDDAAGEAFDKIGKLLGLDYPAGPAIDRWVREKASSNDRTYYQFPRAKTEGFSFSGLKTAVSIKVREAPLNDTVRLRLLASGQEAILEALKIKFNETLEKHPGHTGIVTGGVAANSRLRELLPHAYFPRVRHCSDNAAMVAALAAIRHRRGELVPSPWTLSAFSR